MVLKFREDQRMLLSFANRLKKEFTSKDAAEVLAVPIDQAEKTISSLGGLLRKIDKGEMDYLGDTDWSRAYHYSISKIGSFVTLVTEKKNYRNKVMN